MEHSKRLVIFVILLILFFCPNVVPADVYAVSEIKTAVLFEAVNEPDTQVNTFDISSQGEIMLLFQRASGQETSGYLHIYASDGAFQKCIRFSSVESGTVLSFYDEPGDIYLYYVVSENVYRFSPETQDFVLTSFDPPQEAAVLPLTQRSLISRTYGDTSYVFRTPGFFGAMFLNEGYSLTAHSGDHARTIWSDNGASARTQLSRGFLIASAAVAIAGIAMDIVILKFKNKELRLSASFVGRVFVIVSVVILLNIWDRCLLTTPCPPFLQLIPFGLTISLIITSILRIIYKLAA